MRRTRQKPQRGLPKTAGAVTIILGLLGSLVLAPSAFGQEKELVTLFFPRPATPFLGLEMREVELRATLSGRAREAVLALLAGPQSGLAPAFGPGIGLGQVFVDQAGTAFVDLAAEGLRASGAGVLEERLSLWSLVNTLCHNYEEIKAVKVLVGGEEALTLYGHVDLSRPLGPDLSLIR